MPTSFQILPERNLVYARYDGTVDVHEAESVFLDYMRHPDYRPDQLQLVDLTAATGWSGDFIQAMKLQARKAEAFMAGQKKVLLVYLAPTEAARDIAVIVLRSWKGVPGFVPVLQEHESEALAILGQPETSVAELLANATPVPRQPGA